MGKRKFKNTLKAQQCVEMGASENKFCYLKMILERKEETKRK